MRKLSFYASALSVAVVSSFALTSCVDDDESEEVLAIRKATALEEYVQAEKNYYTYYWEAEGKLVEVEGNLKDAVKNLADLQDGTISLKEAKEVAINEQKETIDQKKVAIAANDAAIAIYKKYYDNGSDKEVAKKETAEAQEAQHEALSKKTEATEAATLATNAYNNLLKQFPESVSDFEYAKNSSHPKGFKDQISDYALVNAANKLYQVISKTIIESKSFKFGDEMNNTSIQILLLETGVAATWTESYATIVKNDQSDIETIESAIKSETDATAKKSLQVDLEQAKATKEMHVKDQQYYASLLEYFDTESASYKEYNAAIDKLVELYADKNAKDAAKAEAVAEEAIAKAKYEALKVTSDGLTDIAAEIDKLETANISAAKDIATANVEIAKLQNEVNDNATMIDYYNTLIAEYQKEIKIQEKIIAEYSAYKSVSASAPVAAPVPATEE